LGSPERAKTGDKIMTWTTFYTNKNQGIEASVLIDEHGPQRISVSPADADVSKIEKAMQRSFLGAGYGLDQTTWSQASEEDCVTCSVVRLPERPTRIRNTAKASYVKGANGEYYVQIADPNSRWGFYLASAFGDDSQSWDGGFGCGTSTWEVVPVSKVPRKIRRDMDWLFESQD